MVYPEIGQFVWTSDASGIGKVVCLQDSLCTVRFFKSVNDSFTHDYAFAQIERAYLPRQTRAYFCDEYGTWSVGRVVDYLREHNELFYYVQFPNRLERRISESDLQVRCLLQVEDPATTLAAGGMETQFLHDIRQAALECLTSARAVSYGLTGLLSSSVELLPHQIEIARRVLNDPIQRYLLADEVGLGKTIEACSIVRQAILDNPEEKVIILAPASLIGQWRRELEWRFFLQTGEHHIRVVPFDQLGSLDSSEVNTLVIDEAHNLIPREPNNDPDYRILENLALGAHRLLLISATPVLGNERTLLALLHLLDPQTYRLDEEDVFLKKVQHRQNFGRILLALNVNQRPVFLRRTLRSLQELVPTDDVVKRIADRIESSLESTQSATLPEDIRALSQHVGDTYRLHQRLIRTRRRDLPDDILIPRKAALNMLEEDDDDRTPLLVDALDQWRQRSVEALAAMPSTMRNEFEWEMALRNSRFHEALGISVEACTKELQRQVDLVRSRGEENFEGEFEALDFALRQAEVDTEETRVSFAKRVVEGAFRKLNQSVNRARLVVFSSSTEFAIELAEQLESNWMVEVYLIAESSDEGEVLDAVDGFIRAPHSSVLVCDRRGEEGLNLQFAHGIVHTDLPLEPARVEQRIGRLDRFGRDFSQMNDISHWVIAPYYDNFHPWQAWYELLRDGFKVFYESISEVQFLLEDLQKKALLALYHRGAFGLCELTSEVMDAIALERERLDEQYALDSRGMDSDARDTFRRIQLSDTARHYDPIDKLLTRVLKFRREPLQDFPAAFRLHWSDLTLLAKRPWEEIVRPEYLSWPMTYQRGQAVLGRGLRLVRPGHELLESIEALLRWDDRGTAFATWRSDPRWAGEGRGKWLGFRLTYVLQANVEKALQALRDSFEETNLEYSLRRRVDSLLSPWTCSMDMDIEFQRVTDPLLLDILTLPYSRSFGESSHRDYNLGSRRDVLYDAIGFNELAQACDKVREASESLLRVTHDFQQWVDVKGRKAANEIEADSERLRRRQNASLKETGLADPGLARDIRINESVISSVASPSIRLDSIGLFVVSNEAPLEW